MTVADEGLPAPPPRERRVLPSAGVVFVLAAVVLGGYLTAGALSAPVGPPVVIGGAVRVTPLSGWELAERSGDPPVARFTRGSANLDVAVIGFSGSGRDLLREYVTQILEPGAAQLSVSRVEAVELDPGRNALRLSYVGTFGDVQVPIEGEVTAIVSGSGVGAIFDGWAPSGLLRYALGDIESMIANAEMA